MSNGDQRTGRVKKFVAIFLLWSFIPVQLFAWGPKGHEVVADVAGSRLTLQTRKNLDLLIPGQSLSWIANWADEIRRQRDESYDWHFVDIPEDADGFNDRRDCFRPQDRHKNARTDHQNCVVDRIKIFKRVLADENAPREQRVEALKWLVHFVADLHQPLHAIAEAHGGNDIKLPAFGSPECDDYPCNLHSVWDSVLLEHSGLSERQYVNRVESLIQSQQLQQKAGGTPVDWANESHLIARSVMEQRPEAIDEAYYKANIRVVDERLGLAGIRLARLLNDALGNIPTSQMKKDLSTRRSQNTGARRRAAGDEHHTAHIARGDRPNSRIHLS